MFIDAKVASDALAATVFFVLWQRLLNFIDHVPIYKTPKYCYPVAKMPADNTSGSQSPANPDQFQPVVPVFDNRSNKIQLNR